MLRLLEGAPLPSSPPTSDARLGAAVIDAARQHETSFTSLLAGVASVIDHGEALVGGAGRAAYAPMDAGTLIALQAGIYRYTEAIDLTAKVVDRATGSARTVLQGGH